MTHEPRGRSRPTAWIAAISAILATLAMSTAPANARYVGPWCAEMTIGWGFIESRCHMRTFEMCRAAIAGTPGAWCAVNPRFVAAAPIERRSRKAHRLRR